MMKSQHKLLTVLITICLMTSAVFAQNRYYVADPEFQAIYKHYAGNELKKTIDEMLEDQYGNRDYSDDISVRFNNGSENGDRLYIGQENTLEFLVSNTDYLSAASLGFKFGSTGGNFQWVQNFGTLTPGASPHNKVLKINTDAFDPPGTWQAMSGAKSGFDSLLLGGIYLPGSSFPLPAHSDPAWLYAIQIRLPDDTSLIGDEFFIDNIFYPSAGDWLFTKTSGESVVPCFNGFGNNASRQPTAPPKCFLITDKKGKSEKKVKLKKSEIENNPNIITGSSGAKMLKALIHFKGSEKKLAELGITVEDHNSDAQYYSATFPVNILPEICQLYGVKYIEPFSNKD